MEEGTLKKTSSELTQESLDAFLRWLDPDPEKAAEKYNYLHLLLSKFFEWKGGLSPNDLADETITRVVNKNFEGEQIHSIEGYALGVARIVLKEHWKDRVRMLVSVDELPPLKQPVDDPAKSEEELELAVDRRQLQKCFRQCFMSLPPDHRELLIGYYPREKPARIKKRKEMAERMGISPNALRLQVFKIKLELRQCLNGCLQKFRTDGNKS